jgi:membrane-associated protease RseP (regulator of RpoE activity)
MSVKIRRAPKYTLEGPGKKIYVTTTEETYKRFTDLATRYRLSLSQFGNLCIMAGMDAFVRAMSPSEAFSPDVLADLLISLEKKGHPINLESLEKKEHEQN